MNVNFALKSFKLNEWQLNLFLGKGGDRISEVAFRIFPTKECEGAFEQYAHALASHHSPICCDVQPLNGVFKKKQFLKGLVRDEDVTSLEAQSRYLRRCPQGGGDLVKLLVVDIKDSKERYDDISEIIKGETEFVDFLQADLAGDESHRTRFWGHIRENNVRFVMLEGRLKCHLLQHGNKEIKEFFQDEDEGRERLCQLCEIIMNFFKRSFAVEIDGASPHKFEPKDYFLATRKEDALESHPIKPIEWDHLPLLTLYPKFYRSSYGAESLYVKTVSQTFNTEFNYDEETETTAIRISESRVC